MGRHRSTTAGTARLPLPQLFLVGRPCLAPATPQDRHQASELARPGPSQGIGVLRALLARASRHESRNWLV